MAELLSVSFLNASVSIDTLSVRRASRFAGAASPGGKCSRCQITDSIPRPEASAMRPRAILSLAACATALHVQRRALLAPAVAGAIGIAPANAGLIDFDPEAAKAAGRARAEQRRAEQKAFTDKLSTLGGVEGQVSTVGGTSAVESREKGSGGTVPCRM